MAHLSVQLLGGFQVLLDDLPVDGFRTQKARALLAYLAVESDRPHTRAHLAGLLWPDKPETAARAYLRHALANLRAILDDQHTDQPFLLAAQQTLQFNLQANQSVDVTALWAGLAGDALEFSDTSEKLAAIVKAVERYRGSFLEGFFLKGCTAFDEWQLLTTEAIRRQVVEALSILVRQFEVRGDIASALHHAWRCAELDPLSDEANRNVIRLLAMRHDSAAALAHYNRFCDLLKDELETTPAPETVRLAAEIAAGQRMHLSDPASDPTMSLPPFLPEVGRDRSLTPLVARSAELAALRAHLDAAIEGQGSVVFVVGEAGAGKTSLMHEFAGRAVERHKSLIAIRGSCSNFRGIGDPYLPFREFLAQLTGDFVAQWEAGEISRDLARRLWETMPMVLEVLLTQGTDLVDTLVSAVALAERTTDMSHGQEVSQQLETLLRRRVAKRMAGAQQFALFDQCTRVFQGIARQHPLLLLVDDLHWGDLGTLALLFHLGQRLDGCRILIVGSFRPEEVALGLQGARHPLERLVPEFQQRYGQIMIDLNNAQGQEFVNAYVDLEPNLLDQTFRETLFNVSGGHPLYTIELLQDMRARGALTQDKAGCWVQNSVPDWRLLPDRIEATIGRRIERLPLELRVLLDAAAVQGGEFCVDVVAAVLGETAVDSMRMLKEVERRHRLVTPHGSRRLGAQRMVYFRFNHILFREYLTDRLDDTAYIALNEAVGETLEALYADFPQERSAIAGRLAWHFQEADLPVKSASYYAEAGDAALRLYAYDEALASFENGLRLIESLPDNEQWHRIELKLLIGLGAVKGIVEGGAASGLEQIWRRANRLSETVGDLHQRFRISRYEWELHFERGDMRTALVQAEACLCMADELGTYQLESHVALGPTLYRLGEMVRSGDQFEQALALCTDRPETHASPLHTENPMVNVLVNGALARWYLGFPDQARRRTNEGIAAAQTLNHPFTLAFALNFAAALYQRAAMPAETERYARQTIALSQEHSFALWSAVGNLYCGWARVAQGEHVAGLPQTRNGLDAIRSAGMEHIRFAAVLADVYLRCGHIEEALKLVAELLATVSRTAEREWEAELHRLKGELTLLENQSASSQAMDCFEQAVEVAAAQRSRSLELRATISLSRLLQTRGQVDEALQRLENIWTWFDEGFDTPDLQTAAEMLKIAGSTRPT